MTEIVVAYDKNGVIGGGNQLPWHLPCDMDHFKALTEGKDVIMGANTWDSLPDAYRPLPNRNSNIVVSMSRQSLKGALIARSIEEAIEMAEQPVVIGGSQIYTLALPYVDTIHATEIEVNVKDGDASFPIPDLKSHLEWTEQFGSADVHFPHGKNRYIHTFVTYLRRNPIEVLDRSE